MVEVLDRTEVLAGVLVGAAVGDSLGLVAENLSPSRARRFWGGAWQQRFFLGRGVVSDDTEHAAMVAGSLAVAGADVARFTASLAWRLRFWLASLPPGIGLATGRACFKLWLGLGPARSGVFSAGNGPSMRAAIIGAAVCSDAPLRRALIEASTRLTHTDPKATWGALAVAEVAALEASRAFSVERCFERLRAVSEHPDWLALVQALSRALEAGLSVEALCGELGLSKGVTGYTLHTVPVALYAWLHHRPSFEQALVAALDRGGDTDSVGAIVGGLAGACVGRSGLPARWVDRIVDWPFGVARLERFAAALATPSAARAPLTPWPLALVRNLVVLALVLGHGFRRLLPPY